MKDYSFFLFCKLYDVYHLSFEEYDLAFERQLALYNEYTESDYNDEDQPEYECMERYIMHLAPEKLYDNGQ